MATPLFDTLALSRRLRAGGLETEAADALTFALHDVLLSLEAASGAIDTLGLRNAVPDGVGNFLQPGARRASAHAMKRATRRPLFRWHSPW